MVRSYNATYIASIPKKKDALELRDFRPMRLIGSAYRLVAKVLAERPKMVVRKFVPGKQSAFIKNRQIRDASLIANEVFDRKIK